MFRRSGLPSKLGERRRKRKLLLLCLFPFLLSLLVAGGAFLTRIPSITVHSVNIVGAAVTPHEELRAAIEENLSGNYFLLFPKRNVFLYPKEEMTAGILERFPRLKAAKFSIEDFETLLLTVEERKPFELWCGVKVPETEEKTTCSFLDQEGFAFAKAPEFTDEVYLRYYGALQGATLMGAGQFLSPDDFKKLDGFVKELSSLNFEPRSIAVEGKDATVNLEGGARLFVPISPDYGAVFENLELSLSSEAFRGKTADDLNYLDLRFGSRVYYRFR